MSFSKNIFEMLIRDEKYDRLAIIACCVFFVLASYFSCQHRIGTFGIETDFYGRYVSQAKNILKNHEYTDLHHPPGYTLLLIAVNLLVGDYFLAGKIITVVSFTLLGWLTYLLLKNLFDPRVAFLTTLFFFISLMPFSFLALTDVVGVLPIFIAMFIFLKKHPLDKHALFWTGIWGAVSYMIRFGNIYLILGIGLILMVFNVETKTNDHRIKKMWIYVTGVMVVLAPWLIYSWIINGRLFTSTAYLNVAASYYFESDSLGTTLALASKEFSSLTDVVMRDPVYFFGKYFNVLITRVKYLNNNCLPYSMGFLTVAGMSLLLWNKLSRNQLYFLFILLLGYCFLGLDAFFHLRFFFFLFPLIYVLVSYSLFNEKTAGFLNKFPAPVSLAGWIVAIPLLALFFNQNYDEARATLRREPVYLFEVADFLKKNISSGESIMVRKPHLAYLAGMNQVIPMENTAMDYLSRARELGIRYVVYSTFDAMLWPGLNSLNNPRVLPPDFRLIYQHDASGTLIYEIM